MRSAKIMKTVNHLLPFVVLAIVLYFGYAIYTNQFEGFATEASGADVEVVTGAGSKKDQVSAAKEMVTASLAAVKAQESLIKADKLIVDAATGKKNSTERTYNTSKAAANSATASYNADKSATKKTNRDNANSSASSDKALFEAAKNSLKAAENTLSADKENLKGLNKTLETTKSIYASTKLLDDTKIDNDLRASLPTPKSNEYLTTLEKAKKQKSVGLHNNGNVWSDAYLAGVLKGKNTLEQYDFLMALADVAPIERSSKGREKYYFLYHAKRVLAKLKSQAPNAIDY